MCEKVYITDFADFRALADCDLSQAAGWLPAFLKDHVSHLATEAEMEIMGQSLL